MEYYIHDGNERRGPFEQNELVANGLRTETLTWREGMAEWVRADALPELRVLLRLPAGPPPPPLANASRGAPPSATPQSRSTVKTALLVSAIANIVVGLIWLATLVGVIFAAPMVVLCIFEFRLYSTVDDLSDAELASKAHLLGIFEIIAGIANTVSLVCGILVVIHTNKLAKDRRVA